MEQRKLLCLCVSTIWVGTLIFEGGSIEGRLISLGYSDASSPYLRHCGQDQEQM